MGLAFWLMPSSASAPALRREMDKLRAANPDAPSFEPHATLIAGIKPGQEGQKQWDHGSLLSAAKDAIDAWKNDGHQGSLTCRLDDVTTRGLYFQCILIALHRHDSLSSLNSHMRSALHLTSQPPFFPHASLLYSGIDADEAQRQIAAMEEAQVFVRSPPHHNQQHHSITFAGLSEIDFISIDLYDCNGPPHQWKRIDSIPLSP
ncbi:hypothetical protein ACQY0O_001236 [Thecaphora frezii]